MLHIEVLCSVVNGAIAVVVVADGAVEFVILKDAIEGVALGHVGARAFREDGHVGGDGSGAGANELSVDFDHAGVTGLDGSHLRQVAHLCKLTLR